MKCVFSKTVLKQTKIIIQDCPEKPDTFKMIISPKFYTLPDKMIMKKETVRIRRFIHTRQQLWLASRKVTETRLLKKKSRKRGLKKLNRCTNRNKRKYIYWEGTTWVLIYS